MYHLILPVLIAAISYKLGFLDKEGSLFGLLLGILISLRGVEWFLMLLLFFFFAMCATKFNYEFKRKHGLGDVIRRKGNVLANGLVPTFMALLGNPAGFLGALATVTSDTLSSEFGMGYGQKPRLITNLRKKVPVGTDGAVSSFGVIFAFVGASIIGIFSIFLGIADVWHSMLWSIAPGILGNVCDSLFGAVLESRKKINNATVNFLASLSGAAIAILISMY